ncbi:MAG: hypothetical protein JW934_06190 [Anaerolineae bacterium]|nr:hypothetical protein [Anaerolineae bacterium]
MAKGSNRTRKMPTGETHAVRLEMPKASESAAENEYGYVIADLKRVAILAAGIFALLVVLSFFIR